MNAMLDVCLVSPLSRKCTGMAFVCVCVCGCVGVRVLCVCFGMGVCMCDMIVDLSLTEVIFNNKKGRLSLPPPLSRWTSCVELLNEIEDLPVLMVNSLDDLWWSSLTIR